MTLPTRQELTTAPLADLVRLAGAVTEEETADGVGMWLALTV